MKRLLPFICESIDFSAEPKWAAQIERWSQLDRAAFSLCETYWRHRVSLAELLPSTIYLASPGASNVTDAAFWTADVPSPARFVHTLPNIRGAGLLKLMNWNGPVFCLQRDPFTLTSAVREACADPAEVTWVAGAHGDSAYVFVVSSEGGTIPDLSLHDMNWLTHLREDHRGI